MPESKSFRDKRRFDKQMEKRHKQFNRLWMKTVDDVNEFVDQYPETTIYYNLPKTERFLDDLCLSGAWINDRIEGTNRNHRKSLAKKIRKALGYTQ